MLSKFVKVLEASYPTQKTASKCVIIEKFKVPENVIICQSIGCDITPKKDSLKYVTIENFLCPLKCIISLKKDSLKMCDH